MSVIVGEGGMEESEGVGDALGKRSVGIDLYFES